MYGRGKGVWGVLCMCEHLVCPSMIANVECCMCEPLLLPRVIMIIIIVIIIVIISNDTGVWRGKLQFPVGNASECEYGES